MNEKIYTKMANRLIKLNPADTVTVPDALAFASWVLDNVCKAEPSDSIDAIINKGILLHALRQLDVHHKQAVVLHANGG